MLAILGVVEMTDGPLIAVMDDRFKRERGNVARVGGWLAAVTPDEVGMFGDGCTLSIRGTVQSGGGREILR